MTWQQAMRWCIDNIEEPVFDKNGHQHYVSLLTDGTKKPRMCSSVLSSECDNVPIPFDPDCEPFRIFRKF